MWIDFSNLLLEEMIIFVLSTRFGGLFAFNIAASRQKKGEIFAASPQIKKKRKITKSVEGGLVQVGLNCTCYDLCAFVLPFGITSR